MSARHQSWRQAASDKEHLCQTTLRGCIFLAYYIYGCRSNKTRTRYVLLLMGKIYEIRDPIHGFIQLNELEWEVINQPAFQRLRRIRQLAWTDMVYPGATHTRFEHSLGVMHVATRLFGAIRQRDESILRSEYNFENAGLDRQLQIIRLAALLHDVGHGPFSHAVEEILPTNPTTGVSFEHEDYSTAIIKYCLRDAIENHPTNKNNFGITVADIINVFSSKPASAKSLVWKNLVSGQMDADRMDYLLRDAYHSGVSYGRYDLDRVIATIRLCQDSEGDGFQIGVEEDGAHAVEGLLIARYMMFTQLYFHKTRSIYDFHLISAIREALSSSGSTFPPPDESGINDYLAWDDWVILGQIASGLAGPHGEILRNRHHHRMVFQTAEVPTDTEIELADKVFTELKSIGAVSREARKSWYKFEKEEISVHQGSGGALNRVVPLSSLSPVVRGLKTVNQKRVYVPLDMKNKAIEMVEAMLPKPEGIPQ